MRLVGKAPYPILKPEKNTWKNSDELACGVHRWNAIVCCLWIARIAPARAARLLKVRRTTRLSWLGTSEILLTALLLNSMYASSRTTRTGNCNSLSMSASEIIPPSGLFGDVRNNTFASCWSTAFSISWTSIEKGCEDSLGTSTTLPPRRRVRAIVYSSPSE